MKQGKLVLSTAAFVVTALSIFAFRQPHHFGRAPLYGTNRFSFPQVWCTPSTCWDYPAGSNGICHTKIGLSKTVTTLYNTSRCTTIFSGAHTQSPQF